MDRLYGLAPRVMGRGVLLAASVLLLGCSTGPVEARVIEDSFGVSTPARLVVNIDNGSIEVNSSDGAGNQVQVTSTVRNPDRVDYRAVQEGDVVEVVAELDDDGPDFTGGDRGGADVKVSVPREIDLELTASNGAITVAGTTGAVSAETSNGRISVTDVLGDVEVKASNGGLDLTDLRGQVKAETSNGSIDFNGALPPDSENSLKTSNGSVDASLFDTPNVEIDAATSNGRVTSSLPVATTEPAKDNQLVGTVGDGGRRLEIRASNGSIDIN